MTAESFARLLKGRRVGRGKFVAFCPVHEKGGRHRPSLSIGEGRKSTIVFKCMSAGCDPKDILAAMGLSWKDILGERDVVAPEVRQQWAREARYQEWLREWRKALYTVLTDRPMIPDLYLSLVAMYWSKRDEFYPEEAKIRRQRERVHRAIAIHGWDAVIAKFEQTEKGKAVIARYAQDTVTDAS